MSEEERSIAADETDESIGQSPGPKGGKALISYVISTAIGLAVMVLRLFVFGHIIESATTAQVFGELSDGFFLPGVLLSGVGLLSLMASRGTYDIFGFGLKTIGSHFNPKKDTQKYYDYRQEKTRGRKGYLKATLFTGLVFLAVSILFLVGYLLAGA